MGRWIFKSFVILLPLLIMGGCFPYIDYFFSEIDQPVEPTVEELVPEDKLNYPIDNFETGITLKPFGKYVTPDDSPVQPERFQGYHSGVDIEADADDPTEENSGLRH